MVAESPEPSPSVVVVVVDVVEVFGPAVVEVSSSVSPVLSSSVVVESALS